MALAGIREINGEAPCILEDVTIERVLPLPGENRYIVQLILLPTGSGSYNFQIFSHLDNDATESDNWTLNAQGKTHPLNQTGLVVKARSIEQIKTDCSKPISSEHHYQSLLVQGLDMGPSFMGLTELWQGRARPWES